MESADQFSRAAIPTGFRRHLLFLKPDILVVADDLAAQSPSRFEWLLHALHSITRTGPDRFEVREGGVRLSVAPVLPAAYTASVAEQVYSGSNLDGKLVTLNLRAEPVSLVRFLVVLTVLKDPSSRAPEVEYSGGGLTIRHLGRTWRVHVRETASLAAPADPALRLESGRQ